MKKKLGSFLSITLSLSLIVTMFMGMKLSAFADVPTIDGDDPTASFDSGIIDITDSGQVIMSVEFDTIDGISANDYSYINDIKVSDFSSPLPSNPWQTSCVNTSIIDTLGSIIDLSPYGGGEMVYKERITWTWINGVRTRSTYYYTTAYSPDPGSDPSESEDQGYYLDPLEDMLDNAITSGSVETIKWNDGDALPNNIMQKLFNNPSLSLDFKFTYEGVEHEVFIGPGQAVNDNTPWYGPLCLLKLYGEKKDTPVANGEYTVVSGDTLNDIAKRFGTTVDDLMAKNPDIKDRNMIYPGDEIKY